MEFPQTCFMSPRLELPQTLAISIPSIRQLSALPSRTGTLRALITDKEATSDQEAILDYLAIWESNLARVIEHDLPVCIANATDQKSATNSFAGLIDVTFPEDIKVFIASASETVLPIDWLNTFAVLKAEGEKRDLSFSDPTKARCSVAKWALIAFEALQGPHNDQSLRKDLKEEAILVCKKVWQHWAAVQKTSYQCAQDIPVPSTDFEKVWNQIEDLGSEIERQYWRPLILAAVRQSKKTEKRLGNTESSISSMQREQLETGNPLSSSVNRMATQDQLRRSKSEIEEKFETKADKLETGAEKLGKDLKALQNAHSSSPKISSLQSQLDEQASAVESHKTKIASLDSKHKDDIARLDSRQKDEIISLDFGNGKVQGEIQGLHAEQAGLRSDIGQQSDKIQDLERRFDDVIAQNYQYASANQVSRHTEQLTQVTHGHEQVMCGIEGLSNRLNNLETAKTTNAARLDSLETQQDRKTAAEVSAILARLYRLEADNMSLREANRLPTEEVKGKTVDTSLENALTLLLGPPHVRASIKPSANGSLLNGFFNKSQQFIMQTHTEQLKKLEQVQQEGNCAASLSREQRKACKDAARDLMGEYFPRAIESTGVYHGDMSTAETSNAPATPCAPQNRGDESLSVATLTPPPQRQQDLSASRHAAPQQSEIPVPEALSSSSNAIPSQESVVARNVAFFSPQPPDGASVVVKGKGTEKHVKAHKPRGENAVQRKRKYTFPAAEPRPPDEEYHDRVMRNPGLERTRLQLLAEVGGEEGKKPCIACGNLNHAAYQCPRHQMRLLFLRKEAIMAMDKEDITYMERRDPDWRKWNSNEGVEDFEFSFKADGSPNYTRDGRPHQVTEAAAPSFQLFAREQLLGNSKGSIASPAAKSTTSAGAKLERVDHGADSVPSTESKAEPGNHGADGYKGFYAQSSDRDLSRAANQSALKGASAVSQSKWAPKKVPSAGSANRDRGRGRGRGGARGRMP
ncbi:MAG: hypothetical protein Q9227_001718 [Pyrenula ochraceoflavens]